MKLRLAQPDDLPILIETYDRSDEFFDRLIARCASVKVGGHAFRAAIDIFEPNDVVLLRDRALVIEKTKNG